MEINRQDIDIDDYKEIFEKESHHDHKIIKDEHGTLRWEKNKTVIAYLKNISLNDLCPLLSTMGFGKNTEVYRKLYRDMGYSLSDYWEIFYWEANNENVSEYRKENVVVENDFFETFNAKQAKKIKENGFGEQLKEILMDIKNNAEKGVLHIYHPLSDKVVSALKKKKFTINRQPSIAIQRDNLYYSIFW